MIGNAPGDRNGLAAQPARVAVAVPAFVVGVGDVAGHLGHVGRVVADDVHPVLAMRLDFLEFVRRQFHRLEQNAVGDADFSDVVHHRGVADQFDLMR